LPTYEHKRGVNPVSRLIRKLDRSSGFGNALNDRQLLRLFGPGRMGFHAGIVIPTTDYITSLSGEPPIAKTNGWGQVPGQS
jgi:hypothetical protein